MSSIKTLLLAGATSLLTATLPASADDQARFRLAQAAEPEAAAPAEATDPVALAEKDVEAAREALRKAMATGKGVGNARQTLTKALKDLEAAEIAAGEPVRQKPRTPTRPANRRHPRRPPKPQSRRRMRLRPKPSKCRKRRTRAAPSAGSGPGRASADRRHPRRGSPAEAAETPARRTS